MLVTEPLSRGHRNYKLALFAMSQENMLPTAALQTVFYDTEIFADLFIAVFLEVSPDGTEETNSFVFYKSMEQSERERLAQYWRRVKRDAITVSYNGIGFDNVIIDHAILGDSTIESTKVLSNAIINHKHEDGRPMRAYTTHPRDLIVLLGRLKGLKERGAILGAQKVLESSVAWDQATVSAEELGATLQYCVNDVRLTKTVYESAEAQAVIAAREKIAEMYPGLRNFAWSSTGPTLAERVIERIIVDTLLEEAAASGELVDPEFVSLQHLPPRLEHKLGDTINDRISFKTPELNKALYDMKLMEFPNAVNPMEVKLGDTVIKTGLGGIHGTIHGKKAFAFKSEHEHHYILDVDVTAYYPNIIRTLGIGPNGLEKEYSAAVAKLLKLRNEAKNKVEKEAYKLVINSATGKLKEQYATFFDPFASNSMVLNGQLTLIQLAEELHLSGFSIVQLNTDGLSVIIDSEKDMALADEIVREWEARWDLVMTRDEYVQWFQRDVNNYVAVKRDGSRKMKGVFKPAGSSIGATLPPIVYKGIVAKMLDNVEPGDFIAPPTTETLQDYIWYRSGTGTWHSDTMSGFNPLKVNRFYHSKQENEIGLVSQKLGRYTKVASNVGLANDLTSVDVSDINTQAYTDAATREVEKYSVRADHDYSQRVDFKHTAVPTSTDDDKEFRARLEQDGVFVKRSARAEYCPACFAEDRSCAWYNTHIHCFKCSAHMNFGEYKLFVEGKSVKDTVEKLGVLPVVNTLYGVTVSDQPSAVVDVDAPDHVWSGVFGRLADATGHRDIASLAGGIATVAAIVNDKIHVDYHKGGEIMGHGYVLLVGGSGCGKGLASKLVIEGITHTNIRNIGTPQSGQALPMSTCYKEEYETGVEKFDKKGKVEKETATRYKPITTVSVTEEFSEVISLMRSPTSVMSPNLIKLWQTTAPISLNKMRHLADNNGRMDIEIPRPVFSLLGSMVPRQFIEHFCEEERASGLLNRMLVLVAEDSKAELLTGATKDYFDKNAVRAIGSDLFNNKRTVTGWYDDWFDPAVADWMRTSGFTAWLEARMNAEEGDLMAQKRFHIFFRWLSLMYMYVNNHERVTLDDAKAAAWILEESDRGLRRLSETVVVTDNIYSKRAKALEDIVCKSIALNPDCTARDILRRNHNIRSKDLNGVLNDLVNAEVIRQVTVPTKGRPRIAYVMNDTAE